MKRLTLLALAFLFVAAPIYVKYETRNLTMNGKVNPFGQAVLIGNTWAFPLPAFAKAFGGDGITLEGSGFQVVQGNRLVTLVPPSTHEHKHKVPSVGDVAIKKTVAAPGSFFVRKAGATISGNLLTFNGAKYVPVADIARAFGGTFTAPAGNLAPGQTLTLNLTISGNSPLGLNQ